MKGGLAHTFAPVSFPPDPNYRAPTFGTAFLQDGNVSMSESIAMMFYIQEAWTTDALPRFLMTLREILQFTLSGRRCHRCDALACCPLRCAGRSKAQLVGGRNRVPA